MLSVTKMASYFYQKYFYLFGKEIDEMKLHKLLYLTQREHIIQYDKPLFDEVFEARKFGPVVPEVRHMYKYGNLNDYVPDDYISPYTELINKVFKLYASQNSWTLSSITHGEYAWQNAYNKSQFYGSMISNDDMRKDASRIRLRRFLIKNHD